MVPALQSMLEVLKSPLEVGIHYMNDLPTNNEAASFEVIGNEVLHDDTIVFTTWLSC